MADTQIPPGSAGTQNLLELCAAGDLYHLLAANTDGVHGNTIKYMLWEACKHGHADVLTWMFESFDCADYATEALMSACEHGYLPLAKQIAAKFDIERADITGVVNPLLLACRYGHVAVAEWLIEEFGDMPASLWSEAFIMTCQVSAMPAARWIAAHFAIDRQLAVDALRATCAQGHLPVVQWLVIEYKLPEPILRAQIMRIDEYDLVPPGYAEKYSVIRAWLKARA
jgi:hypothetical protein